MILTVTLNPAIDCIIQMGEMKKGALNRAEKEAIFPGGKGVNVSLVLNRLGMETCACGFLAGATGKAYEALLEEQKLKHCFSYADHGFTRINTKISAKEETEINGAGPDLCMKDLDTLCDRLKAFPEKEVLVLSGNVPASVKGAYEYIMKQLENENIQVVVDVTGEELRKILPLQPFLIKPNLEELEDLFSVRIKTQKEVKNYAERLQKSGAKNVMVSMGAEGLFLLTEAGECLYAEGVKGEAVNTVGAGDSAVAGFLAGWIKDRSYETAVRLAAAAGTATAFTCGIADRAAIQEMEKKIQVRSV